METMTFGIGGNKTGCTCPHVNGERKQTLKDCSIHGENQLVLDLQPKLIHCRVCQQQITNGVHVCDGKRQFIIERDASRPQPKISGIKTSAGGYCRCRVDERGLIANLSFDCEVHAPQKGRL